MSEGINSIQIFKNYNNLINDPEHNFKNPLEFFNILEDDAKYNWFKSKLCEGMNEAQLEVANIVCDTQRDFLLQEAANITNTEIAIGYAVTYFPILCDTYCSDILGEAILYKSINKPILTVPRLKMVASVNNSDGTSNSWTFPRALFLIRTKSEKIRIAPRKTNSLIKMSASYPNNVNETISAVNKRYLTMESIDIEVKNRTTNETQLITYNLALRADARKQLHTEFELLSEKVENLSANCTLIGHVDFDNGLLQYDMTSISSDPNYIFTAVSGVVSCVFTSKTSDIGRVKISVKMSGTDLNIDVNEDFEYELDVETLQEYTDIYNIDLVKTISTAIKGQILLNRDHDIAHLLDTAIPEMKLNHTYESLNFIPIFDTNGYLSPGYYQSIFQNIVPKFSLISRYMYYNTNLIPTYMLCGIKTSALIESLQEFAITMPQMRSGFGGYNNTYGHKSIEKYSFRHWNILMSHAIPDDRIYILYKPTSKEEEHYANLVNFIYKPLYLVEEITNSEKRVFIRTRNLIELLNTSTVGCLTLPDINDAMTTYDYAPRELNWF